MNAVQKISEYSDTDWQALAAELGARLSENALENDIDGRFVTENYALLQEHGFFKIAIPQELGGAGATHAQLCAVIREIGRHCGSTALSYSMHTHPVALNVFKHLRGDEKATATLRKIVDNDLVIAGTGANDWLESSGEMTAVEGGFRVTAHKHFVSGSPGAQVFVTSSTYAGESGREVLHFAIPFSSEGITHHENWDTLGMRATGSNDVTLEQVFVPEAAIVARRPAGVWHPMWNVILPTAMPLIMSAYVGLADAAVTLAKKAAAKRPDELAPVLGEMLNQHSLAVIAHEDMVRLNQNHGFTPADQLSSDILTRKTLLATAAMRCVPDGTDSARYQGMPFPPATLSPPAPLFRQDQPRPGPNQLKAVMCYRRQEQQ
jgi:acyl-CoA dehydrogenase